GYDPVSLSFAGVSLAGSLTVTTASGDQTSIGTSHIDPAKSANLNWSIFADDGLGFTRASAAFTFTSADLDTAADASTFIARQFDGSTWPYPTVGTQASTRLQITGLISFGSSTPAVFQLGDVLVLGMSPASLPSPHVGVAYSQ